MIPLYGFLKGDTIGLLVLASPDDSFADLAEKLQASASVRKRSMPGARVFFRGREISPKTLVKDSELRALDRFDVVAEDRSEEVRGER
jgi:hypothetical protein